MKTTSRRPHPNGRKKLSGSAALAVLGDGWTPLRRAKETLGAFDTDVRERPYPAELQIDKLAALSVEIVQRRWR